MSIVRCRKPSTRSRASGSEAALWTSFDHVRAFASIHARIGVEAVRELLQRRPFAGRLDRCASSAAFSATASLNRSILDGK